MYCKKHPDVKLTELNTGQLLCTKCGFKSFAEFRLLPSDYTKGERVKYLPHHAEGDPNHPDVKTGCVSSTNSSWVFVKYDLPDLVMTTGDEPYTANATHVSQLVLI